ncbi:MAG: DUF4398 domain-containing protein [Alphaproteobacteria bacterium]|nr:DUF4398 domain-containing protein [Alphaproteobacteria bacterium]
MLHSLSRAPRRALAVLAVGVLLSGCSAGMAATRLVAAGKAVREARERGGPELAPYEMTLAEQHLAEAVRASADCHYDVGMRLAMEAKAQAEAAILRMEGGGRDIQDQGRTGEDLVDEVAPQAPRQPEPEDTDDDFDDFFDEDPP